MLSLDGGFSHDHRDRAGLGASATGLQAALILREDNAPLAVGPQPDYVGKDLDAIAGQLIERYP